MTEKDDAWVDVAWGDIDWDKQGLARGDAEWIDGGKRFLWTSERDGWRHVYSISRDGKDVKCVTAGDFDVAAVETVDVNGGWIYFLASPDNPTQRYLYRSRIDGAGKLERVSPADKAGTHGYLISPGAAFAVHTYSNFTTAPLTEIVRLPQHESVRVIYDNKALQDRVAKLKQGPNEFFRVDVGDGLKLDGWMIKPPDFDPGKKYPVLF